MGPIPTRFFTNVLEKRHGHSPAQITHEWHGTMAAEAMELAFDDNRQAWLLQPDGSYLHAWPEKGEPVRVAQEVLMQRAETDQGNA